MYYALTFEGEKLDEVYLEAAEAERALRDLYTGEAERHVNLKKRLVELEENVEQHKEIVKQT